MPYQSEAQRRYMHAKLPEIAARWDKEMREGKKSVGRELVEARNKKP